MMRWIMKDRRRAASNGRTRSGLQVAVCVALLGMTGEVGAWVSVGDGIPGEDGPTPANTINATLFTASATFRAGTMRVCSFYTPANAGNLSMAIYTDNAGVPGALLGSTPSVPIVPDPTGAGAWTIAGLITPVQITNGASYWLCVNPTAEFTISNDYSNTAPSVTKARACCTWPASFGANAGGGYSATILATDSGAAPPGPSGTITIVDRNGHTNLTNPTINVTNSNATQMQFSLNAQTPTAAWVAVAQTYSGLNVSTGGQGAKTVYARFKNATDSSAWVSDITNYDTVLPTSTITTAGSYGGANPTWNNITGTATDATPGIADSVQVSIQRILDTQYWSGTAWVSTPQWVKVPVTGSSWTVVLATTNLLDGATYNLQSRAIDRAGNVQASPTLGSFKYDLSLAPSVSVPRTADTVALNGTWTIPATVSPANAIIAWYRETDTTTVLSSVATLTLTNVQMSDNGMRFICKVTTPTKGSAKSNPVVLTVVTPVKALFTAVPVTGPQGLTVTTTDASTGSIAQWVFSSGEKTPQVKTFTTKPTNLTFVYPDTGDFTLQLKVIGVSKAGRDSTTQLIKITNKNGYNPLEVTALYLSSTSVKVLVKHILNAGIVRNNPLSLYYADSIGLWYSRTKGAIDTSKAAMRTAFAITGKPDSFAVNLTVAAPAGPADTVYTFWACPLFRKGIDPYKSYSGADLYMRPLNPLAVSGRYVGAAATLANPVGIDSAEAFLDNVQSVELGAAANLTLSWKLRSAATASVLTLTPTEFQTLISGNRATWGWRSPSLYGDTQMVDVSVTIVGKNDLKSGAATASFRVGLPQPPNPCALSLVDRTSGSITVSWSDPGAIDSVRIIYSTDPIPVGNLDALTTSIAEAVPAPAVADRQLRVSPLSKKTGYYIAIQIMKNLRWSKVTASGTVFDSTKDISPGDSVTNTVVVTSASFNTVKNTIDVGWRLDTITGIRLQVGLTWGTDSTKAATQEPLVPGWGKITSALSPTGSTSLDPGPGLQAGTKYYVFLWLKSEDGPFALPTVNSGTSVVVPDLQWSSVKYFPTPTVSAFGGKVVLWRDSSYATTEFSDTLRKYTPASLPDGFVSVGTGFQFTQALNAEAFYVGIKYDSLPAGVTTGDLAIYRDSGGVLLVEWGSTYDPATGVVSVKTANLSDESGKSMPFLLLADTRPPVVVIGAADTSDVAVFGEYLLDTLLISDNNSKVKWQLQYARDGDPFSAKNSVTGYACGSCPGEKVYLTIPSSFITDNTGVRARVTVSDGPHTLTIDISRRALRENSDVVVTEGKNWVPLSATAVLDSPSVKQALRGLAGEGEAWTYDNTQFRLFRWSPAPGSDSVDNKNWVEYSETQADLFSVVPGRVIWVKTAVNKQIGLGRGVTLSLKDSYGIPLPTGQFTDFALPTKLSVCVGDILSASGGAADSVEIYEWVKSKANTYFSELRHSLLVPGMQRNDYVVMSNTLVAYTALNLSDRDAVLRIPPVSSSTSAYAVPLTKGLAVGSAQGWSVQIAAHTGDGLPMSTVYCGYSPGNQPTTYLPSPPSFGTVRMGTYDRATNKVYGNSVVHRSMGNGCAWELAFCNTGDEPQAVVFGLQGGSSIPDGFELRIVSGLGKRFAEPTGSYQVTVPAQGRVFQQVVAGNADYLNGYLQNLPGEKLAFLGCSPNPFRGALQVRFTLPLLSDVGTVRFSLFDMQGKQVWSLPVTHHLVAGVNQVWVNPTVGGHAISTGVFVLRMDALDSRGVRLGSFKTRVIRAR